MKTLIARAPPHPPTTTPAYLQPHPIAADGQMDPVGMVLVAALLSQANTAMHTRSIQYTVTWHLKGVDRDLTETVFHWLNKLRTSYSPPINKKMLICGSHVCSGSFFFLSTKVLVWWSHSSGFHSSTVICFWMNVGTRHWQQGMRRGRQIGPCKD